MHIVSIASVYIVSIASVYIVSMPTRNKASQREKKLYKNCNPYFYSFCQDTIRLC